MNQVSYHEYVASLHKMLGKGFIRDGFLLLFNIKYNRLFSVSFLENLKTFQCHFMLTEMERGLFPQLPA